MADNFSWRAHYNDGTVLDEEGHGFADVDQNKLTAFELIPNVPGRNGYVLKCTPEIRPIFFRRRTLTVSMQSGKEIGRSCIHCLGWQKTVKGVNVASYTFIFEDGSVVVTDDFNAC